jgi:uncharacterized LabA/DUF88 family protein
MPYGSEPYDKVGIFFDMSNLYFAARDMGIRIDYARLLDFLVDRRRLHRAYAYLGVGPDDESHGFITWLSRNGFRVKTKPLRRYEDGTTKANLDMELAIDLLTQAPHLDVAIILSGDGDFARLVDAAQSLGLRVEVAATPRQASSELIDVADRFIDLEANARTFVRAELPPRDRPLPPPRPDGYGRSFTRPAYGETRLPPNGATPPAPAARAESPPGPETEPAPAEPAREGE